jgi:hypothetical protein
MIAAKILLNINIKPFFGPKTLVLRTHQVCKPMKFSLGPEYLLNLA